MGKKKGIAVKFMAIVFAICAVLFAALTVVIIQTSSTSQSQQADSFKAVIEEQLNKELQTLAAKLQEKGKSLSALLATTAAPLILGYDFDALQQLADNAVLDADIVAVTFMGPEGNPLTNVSEYSEKNVTAMSQDVSFEGDVIGKVELVLSTALIAQKKAEAAVRNNKLAAKTDTALKKSNRNLMYMVLISAIIGVLVLCLAIFLSLGRFVVKPVEHVASGIMRGADEVAGASSQMEASSQQLASGASKQAASLQETSASLEELLAMTRKNSENSHHGDELMREAQQVVAKANESMGRQTDAMAAISRSSEETSKIIKTIDEIAFQTNLLALNAAVEAARAGEAGAGFAVVAEEVRNLAMRAAEAAKDTEKLIEEIVSQVKTGADIVEQTNEEFSHMSEKITKVGTLVSEIAEASNEQSMGFDQVNTAITEIDDVTQHTAANAEQSASAATQMHAQAESLLSYVGDLLALIGSKHASIERQKAAAAEGEAVKEPAAEEYTVEEKTPAKAIPHKTAVSDEFEDF